MKFIWEKILLYELKAYLGNRNGEEKSANIFQDSFSGYFR